MKLAIDFPEKDYKFMRDTYKETGITFVPEAIKNECVKAVYNSTSYERKTGKWHCYRCSECKHVCTYFLRGSYMIDIEKRPNYCPNCGAKMEVDNVV